MKKMLLAGVCVFSVVGLFLAGCSHFPVSIDPSHETSSAKTVMLRIDLNGIDGVDSITGLPKRTLIGDNLSFQERQDILEHFKKGQTGVKIYAIRSITGSSEQKSFEFPLVNGTCTSYVSLDSGVYQIRAESFGEVQSGPKIIPTTSFSYQVNEINIGRDDTTKLNISLKKESYFQTAIRVMDGNAPEKPLTLNGFLDSVWGQQVMGSGLSRPDIADGYFYMGVYPIKTNFRFFFKGEKYEGIFDITKIVGDNVIELPVKKIKTAEAAFSIGLADNEPFAISKTYPADGDTISVIQPRVSAFFNHNIADAYQMPDMSFKMYKVGQGAALPQGGYGGVLQEVPINGFFSSDCFIGLAIAYNSLENGQKYYCEINEKMLDEYGKPLGKKVSWTFYTAAK